MKFLVFGSLNIDRVYSLTHLPEREETLSCEKYEIHVGGKGLNQSVSLRKAGCEVFMAGCVGQDGGMLTDFLTKSGVNIDFVKISDSFTGHAVIEVDKDGQNQMILYKGANHEITEADCDRILDEFSEGDFILLQYEISNVQYIIEKAREKRMIIALNPSPYVDEIKSLPFDKIDYLILNEFEGMSISGTKNVYKAVEILKKMVRGAVILTLGADGAIFASRKETVRVPAFRVNAVDTTGAGDTFTGYFFTEYLGGAEPKAALTKASAASAIVVGKSGAAETIPEKDEVESFLRAHNGVI